MRPLAYSSMSPIGSPPLAESLTLTGSGVCVAASQFHTERISAPWCRFSRKCIRECVDCPFFGRVDGLRVLTSKCRQLLVFPLHIVQIEGSEIADDGL